MGSSIVFELYIFVMCKMTVYMASCMDHDPKSFQTLQKMKKDIWLHVAMLIMDICCDVVNTMSFHDVVALLFNFGTIVWNGGILPCFTRQKEKNWTKFYNLLLSLRKNSQKGLAGFSICLCKSFQEIRNGGMKRHWVKKTRAIYDAKCHNFCYKIYHCDILILNISFLGWYFTWNKLKNTKSMVVCQRIAWAWSYKIVSNGSLTRFWLFTNKKKLD